jgi:hypothetical protein
MVVNVSKSYAIVFARAGICFLKLRPVQLFGEPFQWMDTIHYLRMTIDKRMNWSPRIEQFRRIAAAKSVGFSPEDGKITVHHKRVPVVQEALPFLDGLRCPHPHKEA